MTRLWDSSRTLTVRRLISSCWSRDSELDIGSSQVGHESLDDEFTVFLGGEKLGLGGFRGPAEAAEKVNFPGEVPEEQAGQTRSFWGSSGVKPLSELRIFSS